MKLFKITLGKVLGYMKLVEISLGKDFCCCKFEHFDKIFQEGIY